MLAVALESPTDLFAPAFAQRALIAVVLAAVLAAALGWVIVLRELAFFTHASGSGAFPILVIGSIVGLSTAASALIGALVFGALLGALFLLSRSSDVQRRDAVTGLGVAAALALGAVIAASQAAQGSGISISAESLLFGSVLTADTSTLITLAIVATGVSLVAAAFGGRWLAAGFDANSTPGAHSELLLFGAIALGTGAAIPVTGALLTGAILIVPAACARMFAKRTRQIPPSTFLLANLVGVGGLYLALALDLPPGAAVAVVAGGCFFAAAAIRALRSPLVRPALALLAASLLAGALAGCGESNNSEADTKLKVVTTTPQVADIVRAVGGNAVEVSSLLPAGADAHDYEVRPSAVAALESADVVFRSGGDLDNWADQAIAAADRSSAPTDLSRSAVLIENPDSNQRADDAQPGHENEPTAFNSHWYLAPENVSRATRRVRDELVKAAPTARETFRAGADHYLDEIDALNERLTRCAGEVPKDDRGLMSSHNEIAYLAEAFDFEVVAQITSTGGGEPSASELQQAVELGRENNARALVASAGELGSLEKEVAARLSIPLLTLYTDNLTTGDDASTLLGAIEYDVDRIVDAVSDGSVSCSGSR